MSELAVPAGRRPREAPPDLDGRPGRDDVERILDTAASFEAVLAREVKKVPTLRGRTVVNVFFESSTRTSSQLRARRQAPVGRHHVAEGLGLVAWTRASR